MAERLQGVPKGVSAVTCSREGRYCLKGIHAHRRKGKCLNSHPMLTPVEFLEHPSQEGFGAQAGAAQTQTRCAVNLC